MTDATENAEGQRVQEVFAEEKRAMRPAKWTTLAVMAVVGCGVVAGLRRGLRAKPVALPAAAMAGEPQRMVWAWESPTDLTGVDVKRTGVAYLSREVQVQGAKAAGGAASVAMRLRRQPLQVAPGMWMMAVVRVEAPGRVEDSGELRRRVVAAIVPATQQAEVRGLQVDFDATASQVPFYAGVLRELRRAMPPKMPLSITALTSWCGPQSWLPSVAGDVDEAVPMFFRMGGTPASRRTTAKSTSGITQPLCATSVGVATDEPWPVVREGQRVYVFGAGDKE